MLILALLMGMSYFSHQYCPTFENQQVKIIGVNDKTFTVQSNLFKALIPKNEHYTLGDKLILSGKIRQDYEPNFNHHLGLLDNVKITKISKPPSLKRLIYQKFPYQYKKIFQYDKESIFSSLSLKMIGLLTLYQLLMKRYFGHDKGSLVFLICLGIMFGPNFIWLRYCLKQLKVPIKTQICVLLILFPNALTSIPFVFSYSLYLLNIFDHQGSQAISRYCYYAQLSLLYFYEWNPLRSILFRKIRLMAGVYTVIAALTMFLPNGEFILGGFDKGIHLFQSNLLLEKLTFRGVFPTFFLLFLLIIHNKKSHMLLLCISLVWVCYPPYGRVSYIDVGQGDSTLISLPFNKEHYLIDTGRYFAYENVSKQLKKHGIKRLNYLILTHDDLDHVENEEKIIRDFNVESIIKNKNQEVGVLDMVLESNEYEDANENSIITQLELHNQTYLFLGDAGKKQERELVKNRLVDDVSILKLGHHGSDTSSSQELLQLKNIKLAIASSNPKIYNHPHPLVKRRLYNHGIQLLETNKLGTIEIISFPFIQYLKTSKSSFAIISLGD
ncbi:ComEC/Rec2 family competence protein [Erysipelothrix urinaevulpis]